MSYETVWVEYPDIKPTCIRIGALPTMTVKKPDGRSEPLYTLPVLQDPNTGAVIADSIAIAMYLEDTYPGKVQLFPPGTRALQYVFSDMFYDKIRAPLWYAIALAGAKQLHEVSKEYYLRTKAESAGRPLTEFRPAGEAGEAVWAEALAAFGQVGQWMDKNGTGDKAKYVMGETFTFADVIIVGWLSYYRSVVGVASREWGDLMAADGGRWAQLVMEFDEHGWFKVD
ncbi:hypothetical protein EWM64_g1259 [Hericium alpestre]|uniref:GST N-terminal domain-containing protein n=1 Tax=Hericium alpestre TaxID=135208 RepID=A0A4Z0A6S1_9AGAM|nr:hypothetical protein EWM64_g1259 [Hericium alpestre]